MTNKHTAPQMPRGWRRTLRLYAYAVLMSILSGLGIGPAIAGSLADHVSDACQPRPEALSPLAQAVLERVMQPAVVENSTVPPELMFTACNRFGNVLVDGPQIFSQLRDEIAKARYEVDLTTYSWEADSQAVKYIGDGLSRAANRPGRTNKLLVRILVDDITLPGTSRPIDAMYDAVKQWALDPRKVQIQLATYPHWAQGVSHDKYAVIDSNVVHLTGANAQNTNNAPTPWHDTGYVLSGNVGLSALASFDQAWNDKSQHWNCKKRTLQRDCKHASYTAPKRTWLASIRREGGDSHMLVVGRDSMGGYNNATNNPQDQAWLAAFDNAKTTINILTPNINDDAFQDAIARAAGRGVHVRLISNLNFNASKANLPGQGGTNIDVVGSLRQRMRTEFPGQRAKLDMCWFSRDGVVPGLGNGPAASHAKAMTVDGQIAIVGSGNMDTQSWNYSREFNVLIDSAEAVNSLEKRFFARDRDIAICHLIELYETNNAGGALVCSKSALQNQAIRMWENGCNNDEARSALLHKVPSGRLFRLHDSSEGSRDDDWTEILVKRYVPEKLIPSFERSYEDADIRVVYHRNNGLDGKVSLYESTSVPDLRPTLDLYEGNAGTQNLVCSLDVSGKFKINFTKNSPCENDEVRSMAMYNIPAGRNFRLFDNSAGSRDDDWMEVQVKRDIGSKMMSGLEQSFEDADVRVIYHSDNGLEGKVSRLEVR